jgi:hypothetical protein
LCQKALLANFVNLLCQFQDSSKACHKTTCLGIQYFSSILIANSLALLKNSISLYSLDSYCLIISLDIPKLAAFSFHFSHQNSLNKITFKPSFELVFIVGIFHLILSYSVNISSNNTFLSNQTRGKSFIFSQKAKIANLGSISLLKASQTISEYVAVHGFFSKNSFVFLSISHSNFFISSGVQIFISSILVHS